MYFHGFKTIDIVSYASGTDDPYPEACSFRIRMYFSPYHDDITVPWTRSAPESRLALSEAPLLVTVESFDQTASCSCDVPNPLPIALSYAVHRSSCGTGVPVLRALERASEH